jgi:hypothetical protein
MSLTDKTFSLGRPSNYSTTYNADISGTVIVTSNALLGSLGGTVFIGTPEADQKLNIPQVKTVLTDSTGVAPITTISYLVDFPSSYFVTYLFPSSGQFVPSVDMNVGIVVGGAAGGGGGGTGVNSIATATYPYVPSTNKPGGGGAGGAAVFIPISSNLKLLANTTYTITIGKGGTGGASGVKGGDGSSTIFTGIIEKNTTLTITITGGGGGSNPNLDTYGVPGTAGTCSVSGLSSGFTILKGGDGAGYNASKGAYANSTGDTSTELPIYGGWLFQAGGGGGSGYGYNLYYNNPPGQAPSYNGGAYGGIYYTSSNGAANAYMGSGGGGGGGGVSSGGSYSSGGRTNSLIGGQGANGSVYIYCIYPNTRSMTNLTVNGSISKNSGTFDIVHPLSKNKNLIHSFVEGPRCDLIYRGATKLKNGRSVVNIDTDCVNDVECCMELGTFEALCANPMYYLQNHSSFDKVKGDLSGNTLTILCENETSNDTIYWQVIAERKDEYIKQWNRTNNNGYLITEYYNT